MRYDAYSTKMSVYCLFQHQKERFAVTSVNWKHLYDKMYSTEYKKSNSWNLKYAYEIGFISR